MKKKQLPTHETVGDARHAPLCSHRLRSTSTNTNRYTRCCAVDMETAGGARVARSHYHRTSQKKTKKQAHQKNGCPRAACAPALTDTHTPCSASTNTNRYTTCCAVDMRTGGGGRGSHAVRQAPHPHNIEMHQLPTKKMVVDVQHAPLCPHTLRSTPTNTNKYTRCCDVDAKAGGGGHGTHVVRQATYPHSKNKDKNSPPRTRLTTCCMRPCAPTHSAPPREIQINTHAAALSIQRREEAGMGHTRCENRISLTK